MLMATLFVADALVLVLAGALVLRTHGRPGIFEIGLCVVALVMGAWLSCLAILKGSSR
jgi:hypothetical protein